MKRQEKEGLILLFQIDHLSGEEVGWVLEANAIPGLRNRHLIPTLTKKGRPGYLLLLDLDPESEVEAVKAISQSLPFFGYHHINTRHFFEKGASRTIPIAVKAGGKTIEAQIHIRSFPSDRGTRRFFIESDDLNRLRRRVRKELKVRISPLELKQQIDFGLKKSKRGPVEVTL
jgi:uncharacterized protein (DUF111 family)